MNNHLFLFLFTLGPVQSFIAQARKTQDLYAGSRILSRLVQAAGKAFNEEFPSGSIIFPAGLSEAPKDASLPNRFVAKLSEQPEITNKAQAIKDAVDKELSRIAHESVTDAKNKGALDRELAEVFRKQLHSHLDIFWAFEPIKEEGGASFAKAYHRLEQKVGAIKNVRPFEQYQYAEVDQDFAYAENYGERGRKCSVDGTNNALFYRKVTDKEKKGYFDLTGEAQPLETFYLNPGEALSAVSFVKRFYPDTSRFPSTSQVALVHDESQLDEKGKKCLSLFTGLFEDSAQKLIEVGFQASKFLGDNAIKLNISGINNNFDYQYLFEENINEGNFPNHEQRKLLQSLQQNLKPVLKTRYYALIHFDGDSMGKWLSGEYNQTKDNLEEFHEKLSRALEEFGSAAQAFLNKGEKGHTIYAGGDDFMGFVNIHHLFEVMRYLRQEFSKIVDKQISSFKSDQDQALTFSAGIVVAHFKTPFSEVLKQVRKTEKQAKEVDGKNAFAITVLKHSGEIQEAVYKWESDQKKNTDNWKNLGRLVEFIAMEEGDNGKGSFSNTFIQNLTAEFTQLTGHNLSDIDTKRRNSEFLDAALYKEIGRLVARSLKVFESTETDNKRRQELTEIVQSLWTEAPRPRSRNFIHALHVADFLTRKTQQA